VAPANDEALLLALNNVGNGNHQAKRGLFQGNFTIFARFRRAQLKLPAATGLAWNWIDS